MTSIGDYVFSDCSNLNKVILEPTTPPTLTASPYAPANAVFIVPKIAYDAYKNASYWSELNIQVVEDDTDITTVTVTAADGKSALQEAIGEENLANITDLAIIGSINSYDFEVLRTMMPQLQNLDLSKASVVYNAYEHRTGHHTEDNKFPAFGLYYCQNLISIILPSGVTDLGDNALQYCTSLESIVLPEGLTRIGVASISHCDNLESLIIPDNVQVIDRFAFDYTGFTSIAIPENVTSIEKKAFASCSSLASITIPEDSRLTTIGEGAFSNCSAITSIDLPNSVVTIGEYAFQNVPFASISIPNSVTSIGEGAFNGCRSLRELVLEDGNTVLSLGGKNMFFDLGIETVHLGRDLSYIDEPESSPFWGMSFDVTIGECVTLLGKGAFEGNMNLQSIVIPDGVTSIGEDAFKGCANLESITLPNALTTIGRQAFSYCESLLSLTIPSSVTSIGDYVFDGSSNLNKVILEPTTPPTLTASPYAPANTVFIVPKIAYDAYKNASYWSELNIQVVEDDTDVTTVTVTAADGKSALQEAIGEENLANITDLVIIGTINSSDFKVLRTMMPQLQTLDLSKVTNITSLPNNALENCSNLTSVILPGGLTYIGHNAFSGCSGLTSISIPESVTDIYQNAFNGCTSLKEVFFEDGNKKLRLSYKTYNYDGDGEGLFYDCPLERVYLGRDLTYSTRNYGISPFYNSNRSHVTITLGDSITIIPPYLFYNDKALTSIVIPEGVTSIGERVFYNCSSLTSIVIPEGVTSIGETAFYNCRSLTSIVIPEGVTSIGKYVFYYCSSLTSIVIPESVTSIEYYAFCACESLTSITIPSSVASIGGEAFRSCNNLSSVTISEGVSSIGKQSFYSCENLTSITIPQSMTEIGSDAFEYCYHLTDIHIASIESWLSIKYDDNNSHPNYYSDGEKNVKLYIDNEELTEVEIPSSVSSIPSYAFYNCNNLSITLPESVTEVGLGAFYKVKDVVVKSTTPPTLTSSGCISENTIFVVPVAAYNDYISAPYWSDFASQITIEDVDARVKSVSLTADDGKSALQVAVGDANLKYVTDLTISGTINSYDFMIMRNKMPLLRHLDLSEASIVANSYQHYTGYCTEDNKFPGYGLYGCNLFSLVLPKTITAIGSSAMVGNGCLSEITFFEGLTSISSSAFYGCSSLTSVVLPKGLISIGNSAFSSCSKLVFVTLSEGLTSIGSSAFYDCFSLTSVVLPEGLTSIGSYAFQNCKKLTTINLPNGLITINSAAFSGCTSLNKVVLPPTVKQIYSSAFVSCSSLTEIRIPSSVRSLGASVFYQCSSLNDVYVYTVEPIEINQNTFPKDGNNFVGTLHAPKVSYWDYYYDTQWSQFMNFAEFDEPYDNFYVEGDKELNDNTGSIGGTPDVEMGDNSGIIVDGDTIKQDLGDVDIENDGNGQGGSIIVGGNGEVNAEKINFRIHVKGGKWYFFCFPFDIKMENIKCEGGASYVFRYYDGACRAQQGHGGWKDVEGDQLNAWTGYIFQASANDVLVLTVENKRFDCADRLVKIVEHVTDAVSKLDASWNFIGNPNLSYYDLNDLAEQYSAPITIWNGSQYVAVRPGDDDHQFAPFEGFFVQKPSGTDCVEFKNENQMTYNQSKVAAAQARARRRNQEINPERLLVNVTLSDGENTDQTRVVFNDKVSMEYEMECDAAKFTTAGVPQIYTIDSRAAKYAINERPVAEGIVTVGYSVPAQGVYTLAAPRMDTPIYIKDNLTGTLHDFAEGSYEFASEEGTFDDRFTIVMKAAETSIDNSQSTIDNEAPIYNTKGQRVEGVEKHDVYIKGNRKVVSL